MKLKLEKYDIEEANMPFQVGHSRSQRKYKRNREWNCQVCPQVFRTKVEYLKHKTSHEKWETHSYKYEEDLDVYVCNTCSAEFQEESEAEKHVSTHKEVYTCFICQSSFDNLFQYCCHNQTHSSDQRFQCPICSYSTMKRTSMMTHINRMHYHKFYYHCSACGKGFNDSVLCKEHEMYEHLGLKPFVCVVCKKGFAFSRYLLHHQTRYHTVGIIGEFQKNQCKICSRIFAKASTLESHSKKHENKGAVHLKKHLCDMCGQGFSRTDKLKIHYRIHTGIKPYSCSYCTKSFIKKDYLIMHERVHSGERPYTCQYCGKSFNQGAPLRIHVRGHTGERPYLCDFCNVGFISKGSLNLHKKVCKGGMQ